MIADEIQVGDESYEIDARLRRNDRDSLADFEYFHFTLPGGGRVPLGAVAEVETARGWSRIAQVDGLRTVTLRGDVDSRLTNTAAIIAEAKSGFLPKLQEKYPGVAVSFEGEPKEGATTRRSILRGMLVGLLGVFIVLSFQFRSYIEPLIVMAAIPLALVGVVVGHLMMGIDLSMPSILGFVSLAGIVRDLGRYGAGSRERGKGVRTRFLILSATTVLTPLLDFATGMFPAHAEKVLAGFRRITDLPVVAVILTHGHGDHTGAFSFAQIFMCHRVALRLDARTLGCQDTT